MEEPEEIRYIPLSVLTPRTRQVLSVSLNPLSETIIPGCDKVGDYRGLAELLNKPFTFIRFLEQKRDPTGELLTSLKGRDATLTRLWECLQQLGRTDVLEKCRDLFIEDTKRWKNRKPRNKFEAEEIKHEKRRKDIQRFFAEDNDGKSCHATSLQTQNSTEASTQPHNLNPSSQQLKHSSKPSPQPENTYQPTQQLDDSPKTSPQSKKTYQLTHLDHSHKSHHTVSSCTEVKQDKKCSKIKAFFSQKFKSLPHSNPPKLLQGASQTQSHCLRNKASPSSGTHTSVNGCAQDIAGHSRCHSREVANDSTSTPRTRNGTVRDMFSSLPSLTKCSDSDSNPCSIRSDSSNSSEVGDQDTANGGGYKSSLPEPLLTIEDDECYKAMYDAYINSSEEDLPKAKEMLNILEAPPYSLRLFLPDRQLMPGGSRYEDMAGVVEERCHGKVVIILTRHYQNSEACHFVTNFARALDPAAQRKQIIPVEYEKIQLPRMLKGMHIICKARDEQRGWFWNKLTEAIKQW